MVCQVCTLGCRGKDRSDNRKADRAEKAKMEWNTLQDVSYLDGMEHTPRLLLPHKKTNG